jgi:DinB superfamily
MNKDEIIANLKGVHLAYWKTALECPNANSSVNGKWSVAQNTEHLNIALLRLSNYLALPKANIASSFGWSNRASENYAATMALFKTTLGTGVTAANLYKPQENLETSVRDLVDQGSTVLDTFISNLQNWSEEDLETYNCPHPTLGNVTAREILYFTLYHAAHHHETIQKIGEMNQDQANNRR